MRAQTYRPRVQNGSVVRRQTAATARKSSAKKSVAVKRATVAGRDQGASVLWVLLLIGMIIAGIFIYSIRSQNKAIYLSQTESSLKKELGDLANRQRHEMVEQNAALKPDESFKTAVRSGLIQPSLTRQGVEKQQQQQASPLIKKVKATEEDVSIAPRAGYNAVNKNINNKENKRKLAATAKTVNKASGIRSRDQKSIRKNVVKTARTGRQASPKAQPVRLQKKR
ncbi:MAG: hypothetical protein IPL01_23670 [Acidobacteria bacterium]|nr:hypothetical protein [Acidobacteriota bacterium]